MSSLFYVGAHTAQPSIINVLWTQNRSAGATKESKKYQLHKQAFLHKLTIKMRL